MTTTATAPSAATPSAPRRTARAAALTAVVLAWVAIPVPAAFYALIYSATFFGEPPSAAQSGVALLLWTVCTLTAVVLPLVGAGVAAGASWRRTSRALRVLGVVGGLALLTVLFVPFS